jgi:N-glycosylase/DNA lyase
MKTLIKEVRGIPRDVQQLIDKRMSEFSSFANKPSDAWFSELCFCLLTSNAKAKTALAVQQELGIKGFHTMPKNKLVTCIKSNKHRFHNTKAARIVEARVHSKNLKSTIQRIAENHGHTVAREWLVDNVKGLGHKEASHFLRNTGHENVAIIDRHILSILEQHKIISSPKDLSPRNYLAIEEKCITLAENLNMSLSRLDLSLWYLKTGQVLK